MTDGPVFPGAHLWFSELACHDTMTTPYPESFRADPTRLALLAAAFEHIREECCKELGSDCPVLVVSGYRTPSYQASLLDNPALKAALHSQHCEGRAIDAKAALLPYQRFQACVLRAAVRPDSPIRYIELRPGFGYVHFDVRPGNKLITETIS